MQSRVRWGRRQWFTSPAGFCGIAARIFADHHQARAAPGLGGQLAVEIVDGSGQVVRRLDYGTQGAGTSYFTWDGKDSSGTQLPSGSYGMRALVNRGGKDEAADTLAAGLVQSVALGSNGLSLNLAGIGEVPFNSVRQIV